MTSRVWLNGKFRMKPWTQTVPEAPQSPPDLIGEEVSEPESEFSDCARGDVVPWLLGLWDQPSMRHHSWLPESGVLYLFS